MDNKIDFLKNNKAFLTEMMPFETPLFFSIDNIVVAYKNDEQFKEIITQVYKISKNKQTKPFTYQIDRQYKTPRILNVMHLASAIHISNFYKDFYSFILYNSSKSTFSLRYPNDLAKKFYKSKIKKLNEIYIQDKNNAEEELDVNDTIENSISSSYFSYKDYSHMYKFFDSYQYQRLEKKYQFMISLDISKCFYTIYTHSISWAIRSKDIAKNSKNDDCFDNKIDKIMRNANYGETMGILVGPEFSRIFAEMILQRIDQDIKFKLKQKELIQDVDYNIKRYMDDYFIFFNKEQNKDTYIDVIEKCCNEYKLYLNTSKTQTYKRPFITGTSNSKEHIKDLISKVYHAFHNNDITNKIYKTPKKFISSLKGIIDINNTSPESITSITMVKLIKQLELRLLQLIELKKQIEEDENYTDNNLIWSERKEKQFINLILECNFYVYTLSPKERGSQLLGKLLWLLNEYFKVMPLEPSEKEDLQEVFQKNISDEFNLVINNTINQNYNGIHTLDLLILSKIYGAQCINIDDRFNSLMLSQKQLCKFLKFDMKNKVPKDDCEFNYFNILVALDYMGNFTEYDDLRKSIIAYINKKYTTLTNIEELYNTIDTELLMLTLDLSSCPYYKVRKELKDIQFFHKDLKGPLKINQKSKLKANQIVKTNWFYSWNSLPDIFRFLKKKELKSPYE